MRLFSVMSGAPESSMSRQFEPRRAPGDVGRSGWISSIGGVALSCIILVSVSAPASATFVVVRLHPPYRGTAFALSWTNLTACGTAAKALSTPSFDRLTGNASFRQKITATTCGANISQVEIASRLGILSARFYGLSGTHTVVIRWSLAWTVDLYASRGNQSPPANSMSNLTLKGWVLDQTTPTPISWYSYYWHHWNGAWKDRVSKSYSANATLRLSWTFLASHVYRIQTELDSVLAAVGPGGSVPGTSRGTIDFSSPGEGAELRSIAII